MFDTIGKKAAWITGVAAAAVIMYQVTDYLGIRVYTIGEARELEEQVQANTSTLMLQRWQLLNTKRTNQGLTASELVEFCHISRELGLQGQGCAVA